MKLFCGGIPYSWDDNDLKRLFERYGAVTYAHVKADVNTGRSVGYGFVLMPDIHEALEACTELDGTCIDDRCKLKVNEATPNQYRYMAEYNERKN